MECNRYDDQRNKLRTNLTRIDSRFAAGDFFSIGNILFPYNVFKCKTKSKNREKIAKIRAELLKKQVSIWKEVLSYIKGTKRLSFWS